MWNRIQMVTFSIGTFGGYHKPNEARVHLTCKCASSLRFEGLKLRMADQHNSRNSDEQEFVNEADRAAKADGSGRIRKYLDFADRLFSNNGNDDPTPSAA